MSDDDASTQGRARARDRKDRAGSTADGPGRQRGKRKRSRAATDPPTTEAIRPLSATIGSDRLRWPLSAACLLILLGLLAELYRLLAEDQVTLWVEVPWMALARLSGVPPALFPLALLGIVCVALQRWWHLPWQPPAGLDLLLIAAWSLLWALVRYAIAFTANQIDGGHPLPMEHLDKLPWLAQIGTVLSVAIQEEILFRGCLLGGALVIARALGGGSRTVYGICLPLSALFFGLAHTGIVNHWLVGQPFHLVSFLQHCAGGLVLGYAFLRQGLPVSALAHATFNLAITWRLCPW